MSRRAFITVAILTVATLPAVAQIQLGKFNLTGNGNLSAGYTGDFGNQTASDHGLTFGGAGTLNGYFYNPNFLSFNIQPFLNQSRENSNYQSIADSSGVNASTGIFNGSNFPGTVGYTKTFNSQGNFNVPGIADFTSHGDSQVFNVGWSELVPDLPSLTVGFQDGSNHYSLYGADGDLASAYRAFTAQSNYRVAGFTLNGSYQNSTTNSQLPEILGNPAETTDADSQSLSFGLSHSLPFDGMFTASASRSLINADYSSGNYDSTLDSFGSGISFTPVRNLSIGGNFQYVDNLAAALDQSIVAAGGIAEAAPQASHSLSLSAFASYAIPSLHLTINGTDQYRAQDFLGEVLRSDSYTGAVNYSNSLLGGSFSATGSATDTQISTSNQDVFGVMGSVNYQRDVKGWSTMVSGHYSQNSQTALIDYTTSGYGYSAAAGRQFSRHSHWTASASGSRSTFNVQGGSATFSQNYSTVFSWRWVGISGSYSRSSGDSILTAAGLTPVSVPTTVLAPSSVILYGGTAYAGSLSLSPVRGFTITGTYSRALSDTNGDSLSSTNRIEQINAFMQYQVRKIYFIAGYTRLTQSFSSNGNLPAMVGSYYFGLTRWFHFL